MRRSPGIRLSAFAETCTSPAGDPWSALAAAVRGAGAPWESAAFSALYALALAEGDVVLRAFRTLDRARRLDLALDTFVTKRGEMVAADRPRAFFRTVLYRDAVSWVRSPRSRVAADPQEGVGGFEGAPDGAEAGLVYRLDAGRRFEALSARERAALFADALGVAREAIGRTLGASRANVDQIISRARRSGAAARRGALDGGAEATHDLDGVAAGQRVEGRELGREGAREVRGGVVAGVVEELGERQAQPAREGLDGRQRGVAEAALHLAHVRHVEA